MATTSQLVFAPDFAEDSVKLLELPPAVAAALLTEGGGYVVIKGQGVDEATLCTPTQTFVVRQAESSNTQLLLPPAGPEGTAVRVVSTAVTHHLELIPTAPRLARLQDLLNESPLREYDEEQLEDGGGGGGGADGGTTRRCYTFAELASRVQASEAELRRGLVQLQAFELDGAWRVLHPDYLERVFDLVLTLVVREGWALGAVHEAAVLAETASIFPSVVVLQALRVHAAAAEGGAAASAAAAEGSWALDPSAVSRFRALQLLHAAAADAWVPFAEFERHWECSLPSGAPADPALLRGIALRADEAPGGAPAVRFFPEAALPLDSAARFKRLFAAQARWTLADMEPYFARLVEQGPGQTQGSILKRYTRTSRVPGSDALWLSKR